MTPLRAGILAALVTLVADQASKLWLLNGFDLARRGVVKVTPFFDLVLAWNIGISFGWLQNDSQAAQLALMAVKAIAVVALAIWMARSHTRLATVALGLIIGGAIGNGIDRLAYGARWSISPCSTSRSAEIPIIGMCLTSPTWPSLLGWRGYCMIPSWGYPPQKRPDPGRYGPAGGTRPLRGFAACERRSDTIWNRYSNAQLEDQLFDGSRPPIGALAGVEIVRRRALHRSRHVGRRSACR
ncbi:lipoprotein signal peptidase [Bradyrhizobium ottawaense]